MVFNCESLGSGELFRIHIRANSNETIDQSIKYKIIYKNSTYEQTRVVNVKTKENNE